MKNLLSVLLSFMIQSETVDFGHKQEEKIIFTNEELKELHAIGNFRDIDIAANLLGNSLPKFIVDFFTKAKHCINKNPISNMSIYSEFTKYSAYDDLIRYCILKEYNQLNSTNLSNDEVSQLLFDWFDEISLYIFDLNKKPKPLLHAYVKNNACDKKINYHLVVSALFKRIKIEDFDTYKFLEYLYINPDDDLMCQYFLDQYNKK